MTFVYAQVEQAGDDQYNPWYYETNLNQSELRALSSEEDIRI